MPIKTDLNIDPFFDDFDEAKKYYRVLFKPGYAVQARELTQLQTTLQNQIEEFGDNIYKEGTIIRGCNFTELDVLKYVKIVDTISASDGSGRSKPSEFLSYSEAISNTVTYEYSYVLESSSGLQAQIITASDGYISLAPNLNTFFIQYLTSTDGGVQAFVANEILSIREYYTVVTETAVGGADTPDSLVDNGIVATTSVATISNPVGDSYGVSVAEGIIYQKGHFLFVDAQTAVVSKYITDPDSDPQEPDGRSVGFIVDETIVNSQIDEDLLDNATGSPNQQAPGADRLKLSPRLVAIDTAAAEADEEFFTLIKYENGEAVTLRDVTQFNSIADENATNTRELHGDFAVMPFEFDIKRIGANLVCTMSEGIAYVNGYRVENRAERRFTIDDLSSSTDYRTESDQPVRLVDGRYLEVTNAIGTIDIESFGSSNILDAGGNTIGDAVIRNLTPTKIYPAAMRLDPGFKLSDIAAFEDPDGGSGQIDVNPKIKENHENTLIYPTGQFNIRTLSNISVPIRRQTTASSNSSGVIVVNAPAGETFTEDTLNDILIVNDADRPIEVSSATQNTSALVITSGNTAVDSYTIYYTAQVSSSSPTVKTRQNIYVKITFDSAKRFYSTGIPDCFRIISVEDESTGKFYNTSFRLRPRRRPTFYDHGVLEYIDGRPLPPNGELLVRLSVFVPQLSTTDLNYFTVDSYVGLNPYQVGFTRTGDGRTFAHRDCIDFRPYRQATSAYANTANDATVVSVSDPFALPDANTDVFDTTYFWANPAPGGIADADFTFYLPRKDIIVVDDNGEFELIKGEPAARPVPPSAGKKTTLAIIDIPAYPGLTQSEADSRDSEDYEVTVASSFTKTYTMADIAKIDRQVKRLNYYVALNLLEASVEDLLIQDNNGNNRFKNGFLADPFDDLDGCDIEDIRWSAALDEGRSTITPALNLIQAPLRVAGSGSSNVALFGDNNEFATLAYNSTPTFIEQPYGTSYRTCAEGAFKYIGRGKLNPDKQMGYDQYTNYDKVKEVRDDRRNAKVSKVPNSNKYYTLTTPVKRDKRTVYGNESIGVTSDVKKKNYYLVQDDRELNNGKKNGETYVKSVYFRPYMKNNKVRVVIHGLRPNTRHYFFFDAKDVDQYMRPAKLVSGKWTPYGSKGDAIKTNSNGTLYAQFEIPRQTFAVGDRYLRCFDVNSWDNRNTATSKSRPLMYSAYNIGMSKSGKTPTTRSTIVEFNETETTKSLSRKAVNNTDVEGAGISQTFFVKRSMAGLGEFILLESLDLYFKRKGSSGVTVSIREVQNGYPSGEVLPFSQVHLDAANVSVSAKANTATSFDFEYPVRLNTEREYAIVVQPDGNDPDYLIWTSRAGRTDANSGLVVNQDWGDGSLFGSTNGKVWQAYKSEDMKFSLQRYNFATKDEADLILETRDLEFLAIDTPEGGVDFVLDELVYTIKSNTAADLTISNSSVEVTGPGTSEYNVGDYVLFIDGSNTELLLVTDDSVANTLTVDHAPDFSGTFATTYRVVAGRVNGYNHNEQNLVCLQDSSARTGRIFEAGDVLIGVESGAQADVTEVVNQTFSHSQLLLDYASDSKTKVKAFSQTINPLSTNVAAYETPMEFDDNCDWSRNGAMIFSKSNDTAGDKNLKIRARLDRNASVKCRTVSPLVDVETGMVNLYWPDINTVDSFSANANNDHASYVSAPITLEDGFVAEQLNLWLTAHRPKQTFIAAYIRAKHPSDENTIYDNEWHRLDWVSGTYENRYSSLDPEDWQEYEFFVNENDLDGNNEFTYTNGNGTFSGFNQFQIMIRMRSNYAFRFPTLRDVRAVAHE